MAARQTAAEKAKGVEYPISDLNLAVPELRRPFTPAAIKVKPQVVTKDQKSGMVTYYIDSRLVVERLNTVVGAGNWSDEYKVLSDDPRTGLPVQCSLTVHGVTKVDVGQIEPGGGFDNKAWKSAYSDALKRAAVKFGIGAYLYNLPNIWAETKVGGNGKAQGFSAAGQKHAAQAYGKWTTTSTNTYGEPLDHGDIEAEPYERVTEEAEAGAPVQPPTPDTTEPPAVDVPPSDLRVVEPDNQASKAYIDSVLSKAKGVGDQLHAQVATAISKHRNRNVDAAVSKTWLDEVYAKVDLAVPKTNGEVADAFAGA